MLILYLDKGDQNLGKTRKNKKAQNVLILEVNEMKGFLTLLDSC